MPLFQQGHALAIGVADYQDPGLRLSKPITVADAKGVADALKAPSVAAYPPDQVHLIPDGGSLATKDGIIKALEQLAGKAAPTDTAFLYFCGHGVLGEDGEYYLTTQDTSLAPGNLVKAGTGLSKTKLLELLRAVKAQKILMVINACFSGHVGPALAAPDCVLGAPPSATLQAEILGTGEGRALITASRPTQYSYFTSQDDTTYFGQALIDGLWGGAPGSGGYVGLYELYQYLYASVRSKTSNQQDPMLTILQGVGPFPVALYQGGSLGALHSGAIQTTPPGDAAVQVLERAVVQAVKRGAQAFNIRAAGNVSIDQSRKAIDFGSGNLIGNVTIGDVAGRDIIKTTIDTKAAAKVDSAQELLRHIEQLRADVSRLTDAPDWARDDADDGLRRAWESGQKGNRTRMLEKLEVAQEVLLSASNSPTACKVAEVIGTLLQRAHSLKS